VSKSSRASQAEARRARVEELRRAQQAQERRRTLLVVGAVAVVVVVIIGVVAFALSRGSGDGTGSNGLNVADQIIPAPVTGSDTTEQPAPKRVDPPAGVDINGLLAWDTSGYPGPGTPNDGTLGHDHVNGPVKYAVTPPVGGPHNGTWMNAGVYTEPIPSERAVHNLEHGAVWITYNPNLPQSQIDALVAFVAKQSLIPENEPSSPGQANRYMDLSPWSSNDLPSPIVISSWGYQLRVNNPNDPRLQQFVDTFRNSQTYSPEYGVAVDGVPVETGGRPAGYGSKNANPPGAL
jgi:hypothetical protein